MFDSIMPSQMINNPISTRNKILLTCIDYLSSNSCRAVSLDQIATACSIKKQSILYHFKSKQVMIGEAIKLVRNYHERELRDRQDASDLLDLMNRLFFSEKGGQVICRLATYTKSNNEFLRQPLQDYFNMCETRLNSLLNNAELAKRIMARIVGAIILDGLYGSDEYSASVFKKIQAEVL